MAQFLPHIVVVGSINMDLVIRGPRIPGPGETLFGEDLHVIPGGKGANQAVAAARLGAPGTRVSFVGCIGADDFGVKLKAGLAENGINVMHLATSRTAASGTAIILLDAQGQNSIVVAPGANLEVSSPQVRRAWRALGKIDALMLPLETPLEAVMAATELAAADGVPIIFNPAPAPSAALPDELLRRVKVLVPNEYEAAALTGQRVTDEAGILRAARRLRALGAESIVMTLGERGSLIQERALAPVRVSAFEVRAVDTVAAGDCFMGALTARLVEGHGLRDAVRFATAASAIAVTRHGAQPSLPRLAEVEEFLSLQDTQ